MTLAEQITRTRSLLRIAKPRSRRSAELEQQLRALIVKQLRRENRNDKRKAVA